MNGWVSHYFPVDTVCCDYVIALSSSGIFIHLFFCIWLFLGPLLLLLFFWHAEKVLISCKHAVS